MSRVLYALAVVAFAAPAAFANYGPPPKIDPPQTVSPAIAALAGAAAAVLAGYWLARRPKP